MGRHRRFGIAALPSHVRSPRWLVQHQGREGDDHAPDFAKIAPVAVNDLRIFDYLRRRKPREIVGHVNTHLVTRARRFVWAADQLQTPFIKTYMSTRLEPTPFFPNVGNHYDAAP